MHFIVLIFNCCITINNYVGDFLFNCFVIFFKLFLLLFELFIFKKAFEEEFEYVKELFFNDKCFKNEANNMCEPIPFSKRRLLEQTKSRMKNEFDIRLAGSIEELERKIKSKLEDVEDLFIKYDLIIYTPTITVGVDFNKKYFDNDLSLYNYRTKINNKKK